MEELIGRNILAAEEMMQAQITIVENVKRVYDANRDLPGGAHVLYLDPNTAQTFYARVEIVDKGDAKDIVPKDLQLVNSTSRLEDFIFEGESKMPVIADENVSDRLRSVSRVLVKGGRGPDSLMLDDNSLRTFELYTVPGTGKS